MSITHLAAPSLSCSSQCPATSAQPLFQRRRHPRHACESPSRVPRRSCALSSAELLFQHAGVCIDTHRKTCIGSRSFGKAFGGSGGAGRNEDSDDCSTTTVMTIAQSSTEQHIAAQNSTQQLAAAHSMQTSSSQQLTIALCISHMNIYIYKYVYLAALSLSCSFQCLQCIHPAAFSCSLQCLQCIPVAFPSAWDTQVLRYRHTQQDIHWLSLSSSCVRVLGKAFGG